METKEKDNQHYVPQFYFRQFSPDAGKKKNSEIKSICMLNRNCGKLVEHASIRDQASKSKFYGDKEAEDEVTSFDTRHHLLHTKILKEETLSNLNEAEFRILRENIIFQRLRTPNERARSSPIVELINNIVLPQFKENPWDGVPDSIHEQMYKTLQKTMTERGDQIWQLQQIREAHEKQDIISDLSTVLAINSTEKPFIFSDSPIVLCNPALRQLRDSSITNIHSQGLMILYPISHRMLLFLYDASTYKIKNLKDTVLHITKKSDIDNINKSQIHEALKCVYFGKYEFAKYVQSLWKKEKTRLSHPKSELVSGSARSIDGVPLNISGYSTVEAPPNFHPLLSFCQEKPLEEDKIYFPFRKKIVLHNMDNQRGDI